MSEGVPEGWEVSTIGAMGKVVTGSTPSTQEPAYWGGPVPFISPADFQTSVYVEETERTLSEEGAKKGRLLPKDSVLVTCIGSLGGIAMNPKEATTNQQINAVVPHKNNNPRYCYYAILHNIDELKKNAGTTTLPIINKSTFETIGILRATEPEQQKISSILSSVDEVIEKTEAQIGKLQDLKKGMMQELLTKGIGHTEFKDSPVGRIPKGWECVQLEQIVDKAKPVTYGIVQAGPHIEGGIPYVRVSDMNSRYLSLEGMLRTSPEIAEKYNRSAVRRGDIVYALRGMIGHVHIVPKELDGANLTQGTARISTSSFVDAGYLLWALKSPYVEYQNDLEAKGSTFREVTLASLRKINVCLPSTDEQQKITSVLNSIDRKIFSTEDKCAQLVLVKKALMQDLLTGKVRVSVN